MSEDIEVIHMTAVEWDRALTNSLNDLGLTWEQLTAQARDGDFESLKARQLWLLAGGQGPNQAETDLVRRLAEAEARAEFAEDSAVTSRERLDRVRRDLDEARGAIRRLAAEAHRRKWAYESEHPATFDELHRLGMELLAVLPVTHPTTKGMTPAAVR